MRSFERAMQSLAVPAGPSFRVRMVDGQVLAIGAGAPAFEVSIRRTRAYRRMALQGHIGLLESYFDGDIDLEGDLGAAFRIAMDGGLDRPRLAVRIRNQWHELRHSNATVERAKANARFHYGLGRAFYAQWLDDPLMMYTCAYWDEGVHTLEEAQRAKVEHVCRKVRLAPGERVLDVGCGFGGFMFHAAEHHGVEVTGLNTTTEQVEELRKRITHSPHRDRLSVVEADFREVFGQFDKVVSIGTLEHAGRDQLLDVVRAHADLLKPGGLGMLHFIGHVQPSETEFFIRRYVFPGGWIPSLSRTLEAMEQCGLEVVDIENLRRHYALTLDAWAERFEARWAAIRALDPGRFNERFRRIWRSYLVGCAQMFRAKSQCTHLFQITFSKGNITKDNYPMSRRFLYEPQEGTRGARAATAGSMRAAEPSIP
jgi:cyclopropane-fatty-acyl-phospholipid synthase